MGWGEARERGDKTGEIGMGQRVKRGKRWGWGGEWKGGRAKGQEGEGAEDRRDGESRRLRTSGGERRGTRADVRLTITRLTLFVWFSFIFSATWKTPRGSDQHRRGGDREGKDGCG